MQVFLTFLYFTRDSNNKNSGFLKGFESSTASLSVKPSLSVTYAMLNKELSSISHNVLLSENASSGIKISPSAKLAVLPMND